MSKRKGLPVKCSFPSISRSIILELGIEKSCRQILRFSGDTNELWEGILSWVSDSGRWNYRFSAFWLRSKCSICSYQLNIWYAPYPGASILNWFLTLGEVSGACSAFATGCPGIAVPPGSALSSQEEKQSKWKSSSSPEVYLPPFSREQVAEWVKNLTADQSSWPSLVSPLRKKGYLAIDSNSYMLQTF